LARRIAAQHGTAGPLDGAADGDLLEGLREAYNAGRRPDLLDLDQVAAHVRALGVPAVVVNTSGGQTTLYAGTLDGNADADDPTRYPVSLGPGGDDHTGLTYEMSYGPTDDEDDGPDVPDGAMPADVAAGIVDWVHLARANADPAAPPGTAQCPGSSPAECPNPSPPAVKRWRLNSKGDLLVNNNNDDDRGGTGDQPPTDLAHLLPDNLKIGSVGVFAGDWAWTGEPPRIPVGFVGTLTDYWNGAAVWRCTREVAEAVVADQQRLRDTERTRLIEQGLTGDTLDRTVDENVPPLWFDGDDLVLDETALHGEQTVDRQSPGPDGWYCPMGFNWTWQAIDPADCDHIAGTLPDRR
jgi:hypothetical protein